MRWTAGVVLLAAILLAEVATAQAPTEYQRPSVTIVGLDLPSRLQAGLNTVCNARCAGTGTAERADVNAIGSWTYTSGVAGLVNAQSGAWAEGATATIQNLLGSSGVTRNTLKWQFAVGPDFSWRLDTLAARARYAITVEEAQRLLRAQRGVTRNELRQVLPTYFFVFTVIRDSVTPTQIGTATLYSATGKVLGAVYRFNYPDIAALGAALTPISCFRTDEPPTCTDADRTARQAAFDRYLPPVVLVTSFAEIAVSVGASSEGQAWNGLAGSVLGTMISKTVAADERFAAQGRVIAHGPVAARIGRKEGVSRNSSRFVAMRRDSTPGRPARNTKVGAFIGNRVADNRTVVFVAGPNGSRIAKIDSSTFTQIHGGSVRANRGITLRETRYIGSINVGAVSIDDNVGLAAHLEYRVPGLPAGMYVGLAGSAFSVDSAEQDGTIYHLSAFSLDPDSSFVYRVGLALGHELFPAHGYLRLRFQGDGGISFFKTGTSGGAGADAGAWAGGSATLALVPSYKWMLYATVAYVARFADCAAPSFCVGPQGVGFGGGIRIEP